MAGAIRFTEAESRFQVIGAGRGRGEALLLHGYGVSVWSSGKVLEIDRGNGAQHYECSSCHRCVHSKMIKND